MLSFQSAGSMPTSIAIRYNTEPSLGRGFEVCHDYLDAAHSAYVHLCIVLYVAVYISTSVYGFAFFRRLVHFGWKFGLQSPLGIKICCHGMFYAKTIFV